jgi:hypothetical protein
MSKFPITINATTIFDRRMVIPGVPTSDWRDPPPDPNHNWHDADTEQLVHLEPGTYVLGVPSCNSEIKFQVTGTGTVTFDETRFKGCLEVSGGNRLIVNGRTVTLDARYVAMGGAKGVVLGAGGLTDDDWIVHRTINLLPGSAYHVEQGSAVVSSFVFAITHDGYFDYDHDHTLGYDLSQGGFLGGRGTSTLVFRGYPFLVDATQVGERVGFSNVQGLPMADNAVVFVNLLPMQVAFRIGFSGGSLTETGALGVTIGLKGNFELMPPATVTKLMSDSFHGLTRLTIVKR